MPLPEDRLEMVEQTLNKVYGDITRELVVSKGLTEDAVKRLVSQKIILDEHAQILRDYTTRLDRIETMLAQILTHLKEGTSTTPTKYLEPTQRRERTFFERMMGFFPEDMERKQP
ncbi:MAG: hypothetical protein H0V70_01530 [Ktedonobacteraceae bacterium]|nr:hypothetical protein [Ktedonobacteraceae bacterium]